jgi:hypothetical protein
MPHVVFDQSINLDVLASNFEPIFIKEPYIIKIQDIFVSKSRTLALVPTVVVDKENQNFLIEISAKNNKTTVRLFPWTDPAKTDGVKMALGYISAIIQRKFDSAHISRTNILEFIPTI